MYRSAEYQEKFKTEWWSENLQNCPCLLLLVQRFEYPRVKMDCLKGTVSPCCSATPWSLFSLSFWVYWNTIKTNAYHIHTLYCIALIIIITIQLLKLQTCCEPTQQRWSTLHLYFKASNWPIATNVNTDFIFRRDTPLKQVQTLESAFRLSLPILPQTGSQRATKASGKAGPMAERLLTRYHANTFDRGTVAIFFRYLKWTHDELVLTTA